MKDLSLSPMVKGEAAMFDQVAKKLAVRREKMTNARPPVDLTQRCYGTRRSAESGTNTLADREESTGAKGSDTHAEPSLGRGCAVGGTVDPSAG